jgi:hypothetical protein
LMLISTFTLFIEISLPIKSINGHYFGHEKKILIDLFRATLYRVMLVLHKDALFHYHTVQREPLKRGINFIHQFGNVK